MKHKWLAPLGILVMIVMSIVAYPALPEIVPSHWNIHGEVDGTMHRLMAVLFMPGLALGVWLLMLAVPRIDPRGEHYVQFRDTYQLFINIIIWFFVILYAATLAAGLGWSIPIARVVGVTIGLLFALLGNELARVQPSYFVGIRTPWTLSDNLVWRRTHRVGGRAMVLAGALDILAGLTLPPVGLFVVVIGGALGFAAFSMIYSYVIWRQLHTPALHSHDR